MLGKECDICNKEIITHDKMKLFPQPDTLIEDAERIKQSSEEKEDYSDLYTKICDKDLIAAYNKCRIKLIR